MDDIKKIRKEIKDVRSAVNPREAASGPRRPAFVSFNKSLSNGTNSREPAIAEWQAPAFRHYPKDVSWYWVSVILCVFLLAFAVWQKNFLFAVFVVTAEIAVLILARRQPISVKFKISEQGITVADKIYNYGELEKFCLRTNEEDNNFQELIVKKKFFFNPYLKILVEKRLAFQVKEILSRKLTAEDHKDSLLETIVRWLRF